MDLFRGTYVATPGQNSAGEPLPNVAITGTAETREGAISTARRAAAVFTAYITSARDAARIPEYQRIHLSVVTAPNDSVLVKGRNLIAPLAVFAALMLLLSVAAINRLRPRLG